MTALMALGFMLLIGSMFLLGCFATRESIEPLDRPLWQLWMITIVLYVGIVGGIFCIVSG